MIEARNFIGGEWCEAFEGGWLERRNPATGEVATKLVNSGHLDVVRAIQAANKALANWMKLEPEARTQQVLAFARLLEGRLEEVAQMQSRETGVPITASRSDVRRGLNALLATAHLYSIRTEASFSTSKAQFSAHRLPIGIIGLIASWSEAVSFLLSRIGAALLNGNCVIAKPSSLTAGTAQLIAHAAKESGLPPGVLNFVQGRGEEVARLLVEHPSVSTIAFAGSTETGRDIEQRAAENLKRTQLALSACNSVLVFADTDLEKTAAKVARLTLSQLFPLSSKGTRVFVQESVYKRFLEIFEAEVKKLVVGDPFSDLTHIGPLAREEDVKKHESAIALALSEKGKLLVGGQGKPEIASGLNPTNFVLPTVIYDLTLCSVLQQEEAPGPFCLVSSFKYQHEAVKHANTSPFGQVAHVFHSNVAKAHKIAQKLEAGRIFMNPTWNLWDPRINFGGLKSSGLGREGVEANLDFFARQTSIHIDLMES